jgi:hypothetical protein
LSFTVTRSGALSQVSTVNWSVVGATSASDFSGYGSVLPSGVLTFAAGDTTKTITVNVAGDSIPELDETFSVLLSSPSAGTSVSTSEANGTILNDDAWLSIAPSVGLASSNWEGNPGSTPVSLTFTVTRSGFLNQTTTVGWSVAGTGSTPADAADFSGYSGNLPSGTVSFAPGETSKTINVNVAGDSTPEALQETFKVVLNGASAGATIETNSATTGAPGSIGNEDGTPLLSLSPSTQVLAEGTSPTGSTAYNFSNLNNQIICRGRTAQSSTQYF